MNNEDRDDLWQLLGKARQPAVSPFFSRNVLREVRNLQQERPGFISRLRRHWLLAAAGSCAAILITGALLNTTPSSPLAVAGEETRQLLAMAETVSESPDYQVIAHLDELLESEENSIWLDGNIY